MTIWTPYETGNFFYLFSTLNLLMKCFATLLRVKLKQPYLVQICLRKCAPVDARPWNSFLLLPALIWTAHSVVAFNSPNNHKFTKNITVHCSIQNKPDIDNLSHCLWCGSVLSRQNNKLYNGGGRENLERERERETRGN